MNATSAFSTAGIAPSRRAARWTAAVAQTYFPLELTFRDRRSFNGRLNARSVGTLSLSRLTSDPLVYERRKTHLREAREEEYLVTIPCAAPVEFRQMGRDVRCDPGALLLERGDEPYRFLYKHPNDLFVLKVPRSALADRVRNPDEACAQIIDATSGAAGLLASMVHGVYRHIDGEESEAALMTQRHLLDLLVMTLNRTDTTARATTSSVRAAHLERAEAYIRANLQDPALRPEPIAEACGISKRYLHSLFAEVNETVSKRIRDQRLDAARDLIAIRPGMRIAEVAYRFGFADHGQFTRLFKARFGHTPSGLRERALDRTIRSRHT